MTHARSAIAAGTFNSYSASILKGTAPWAVV
jgi:hypothetical protein